MRVLYFSKDYTTHDRRYLASLAGSGHQVWYLRLERGPVTYEGRDIPPGVQIVSWVGGQQPVRRSMWPRLFRDFRRVLDEVRPHLVHAGPIQSCGFLSALVGVRPLVVMSWGSDVLVGADRNLARRWLTRYTLRRADVVIGDCRAVRDKVRALSGIPDERIVTYPWGIDLDTFRLRPSTLDLRDRLGWGRARIFLSTRSWEPLYRLDVLVAAFNVVAGLVDDACLLLLGDGSAAPQIRRVIAEGRHPDRVHVAGQVPHTLLPEYYNLADAYVSTAGSDGTSISLLEAMACGLPVIVSDTPGNREWVVPGENGWLFEPGNSEALTTAMLASLDPSAPLVQMREANVAIARKHADWTRNFQLLLGAYARAIRPHEAPVARSIG